MAITPEQARRAIPEKPAYTEKELMDYESRIDGRVLRAYRCNAWNNGIECFIADRVLREVLAERYRAAGWKVVETGLECLVLTDPQ